MRCVLLDGRVLLVVMAGGASLILSTLTVATKAGANTIALMEGHEAAVLLTSATHVGMATSRGTGCVRGFFRLGAEVADHTAGQVMAGIATNALMSLMAEYHGEVGRILGFEHQLFLRAFSFSLEARSGLSRGTKGQRGHEGKGEHIFHESSGGKQDFRGDYPGLAGSELVPEGRVQRRESTL